MSNGFNDEEDDSERLPLASEDRGSESLESPAFQQAKADTTVADAAAASEAIEPATDSGGTAAETETSAPAEESTPAETSPAAETPAAPQASPRPVKQRVGSLSDLLPASPYPEGYAPRNEYAAQFAADEERRARDNEASAHRLAREINTSDPYQAEDDGRWVRRTADPLTGDIHEVDLLASGQGKVDHATGNILVKTSAGPVVIGQDPQVTALAQLLQQRRLMRSDADQFKTSIATTKANMNEIDAQMQAFGPLPDALQKRMTSAQANASLNPNDDKYKEKLVEAQQALSTWRAANPNYEFLDRQRDQLDASVRQQTQSFQDSQRTLNENLANMAYVRAVGHLPPANAAISTAADDVPLAKIQSRAAEIIAGQQGLSNVDAMAQATREAQQAGAKTIGGVDVGATLKNLAPAAPPPATEKPQGFWSALGSTLWHGWKSPEAAGPVPGADMSPDQLRQAVTSGALTREQAAAAINTQTAKAQSAADVRDNGVNPFLDFGTRLLAANSQTLNRAAEGVSRVLAQNPTAVGFLAPALGALPKDVPKKVLDSSTDWFKQNADGMKALASGKWGTVNPAYNNSVEGAVAEGLGTVLATIPATTLATLAAPEAAAAGTVTLLAKAGQIALHSIPIAVQFASSASADAFDEAKQQGKSDDQATHEGGMAALSTLKALPLYMAGGAGATAIENAVLPKVVNPLTRFASHLFLNGAMNMAASATLRGMEGGQLAPDARGIAQDMAFALHGAVSTAHQQSGLNAYVPVARNIVSGTDADFATYSKIAADESVPAEARQKAGEWAQQMQANASKFLDQMGLSGGATKGTPAAAKDATAAVAKADDLRAKVATAQGAGDAAATAKNLDALKAAEDDAHKNSQAMMLAIPTETRKAIAKAVSPDIDFDAAEEGLAASHIQHFGLMSIGEGVRDAYLTPDREGAIERVANSAGADDKVARDYTNQMIGLRAVKDLESVLTGGSIAASKAAALENAGLLHTTTEPDGSSKMRVTEDALPLLSQSLQKATAIHSDKLALTQTAGNPADALAQHVKIGMGRMGQTADALVQKANAPNPDRSFRVRVVSRGDNAGAQQLDTIDISAPDAGEAEKRARAQVESTGRLVKVARAQELKAATSTAKASQGEEPASTTGQTAPSEPMPQLQGEENPQVAGAFGEQTAPKDQGQHRALDADEMTGAVRRVYGLNQKLFAEVGISAPEIDPDSGRAIYFDPNTSKLIINPKLLAEESANLAKRGFSTADWVANSVREEFLHGVQIEAERRAGREWQQTYSDLWNDPDLDPALKEGAGKAYLNFDQLSDAQKGAEAMRMVLDGRWKGTITERVFRAVQSFVDYLRGLEPSAQKSQIFRDVLSRAEKVLSEAQERAAKPAEAVEGADTTGGTVSAPEAAEEKKGSTQVTLPPAEAKPFQEFAASIPDSDVYRDPEKPEKDGREFEPHVTALYGLTGEGDTTNAVREAIKGHDPITLTLGKISKFSNADSPYDVLKIDVTSPQLHALNKTLRKLPHKNDYPDYHPHLTLAYVNKGAADEYVGDARFEGKTITIPSLTHSSADRVKTDIRLTPDAENRPVSSDEREPANAETASEPDWSVDGGGEVSGEHGADESGSLPAGDGEEGRSDGDSEHRRDAETQQPAIAGQAPVEDHGGTGEAGGEDVSPHEGDRALDEYRRELAEGAMPSTARVSLYDAVRQLGGLPSQSHKLWGHYGEELSRVLDAFRGHNKRREAANLPRLKNRTLFKESAKSPDDLAQRLGFDDPNELLAALESELTTGKTHWINPEARRREGMASDDELAASKTKDTGTMDLGLGGDEPGGPSLDTVKLSKEATPREKVLADQWSRLTAKMRDGGTLTPQEQNVYMVAEKELGQKYLVNLDDTGLQRRAGGEEAQKQREQAAAIKAGQSKRLTGGAGEDQTDIFSGRPEDKQGNGMLFASGTRSEEADRDAAKSPQDRAIANVGLALHIANEYRNIPGVEFGDVAGEAKHALIDAARGYPADASVSFADYAGRAIRNRLNDLYGKESRYAAHNETTLDEPKEGEDGHETAATRIPGADAASVTRPIDRTETNKALMDAVQSLAPRPREVLMARLRGKSLEEIGRDYLGGVSKEAARKTVNAIMARVKANLADMGLTRVESDGVLAASTTDQTKAVHEDFQR
ncbi:MAG: sigma-70 family RNA polymerase sigma factor, partial [Chthoniobacter sp.]